MSDRVDIFAFERVSEPKPGSAQCPECARFARVVVAGHYAYPDGNWNYTVDCKKCGRVVLA